jgi:murein DD-endopeptidase MepM/ murein hydrolase activator NlpD
MVKSFGVGQAQHMKFPSWAALLTALFVATLLTSPSSTSASSRSTWELPIPGVTPAAIVSEFAPPTSPFRSGHRGVDFPATQGQRVTAVGSGIVSFAGPIAGKPVISIELVDSIKEFGTRVRSTYEPVTPLVSPGNFVTAGSIIGYVDFAGGKGGHCQDTCLHFGIKVMGESTTRYLSPRNLWRSLASLRPSSVRHRNLIAGGQSQKFFVTFPH